jgi:hypothetical protein
MLLDKAIWIPVPQKQRCLRNIRSTNSRLSWNIIEGETHKPSRDVSLYLVISYAHVRTWYMDYWYETVLTFWDMRDVRNFASSFSRGSAKGAASALWCTKGRCRKITHCPKRCGENIYCRRKTTIQATFEVLGMHCIDEIVSLIKAACSMK